MSAPVTTPGPRGPAALVLAGGAVVAYVVGALPWLITGLRLPISSAWPSVLPEDVVLVPLPFGEYELTALAATGVVGLAAAASLGRALGHPAWVGVVGGAVSLLVALGLSYAAVADLLAPRREAELLLAVLIATGLLGIATGALVGLALRPGTWLGALAVGVLVVLGHAWLMDLLVGEVAYTRVEDLVARSAPWTMAALTVAALLFAGWRRPIEWLRWPVVLLVVWVGTAVLTVVAFAAAYARSRAGRDLADASASVLSLSVSPDPRALVPSGVAVVVAMLVSGALIAASRRGPVRPGSSR
ncbi:hypothetical protein GCM10027425_25720 [Alteromonas gracilis]